MCIAGSQIHAHIYIPYFCGQVSFSCKMSCSACIHTIPDLGGEHKPAYRETLISSRFPNAWRGSDGPCTQPSRQRPVPALPSASSNYISFPLLKKSPCRPPRSKYPWCSFLGLISPRKTCRDLFGTVFISSVRFRPVPELPASRRHWI